MAATDEQGGGSLPTSSRRVVAVLHHEELLLAESAAPLLGASCYTPAERQASIAAGFARGGVTTPLMVPAASADGYSPLSESGSAEEDGLGHQGGHPVGQRWTLAVTTLVSIQLGFGLWLLPYDYARLGWGGATIAVVLLAGLTMYSGVMFGRLRALVPDAVLFVDIGEKAYGKLGRRACYAVVCSLDATRCVILHLAAAQSLQRAAGAGRLSLWAAGGCVAAIEIALSQVQSLVSLSWFLTAGTAAQQIAIALVLARLSMNPDPNARHELFLTRDREAALVAVMNIVFAFGGQFSWVEVMNTMRQPQRFPSAIATCTAVMTAAYLSVGGVGYWSKGERVTQIVLFALDQDAWARAAACLLLIQATAQYLANINIWAMNICALLRRKTDWCPACGAQNRVMGGGGYPRTVWAAATAFVAAYSWLLSGALPYFSELVAYMLPAAFCLKLLVDRQSRWETYFQRALIPTSMAVSAAGLYASTRKLLQDIQHAADAGGTATNVRSMAEAPGR